MLPGKNKSKKTTGAQKQPVQREQQNDSTAAFNEAEKDMDLDAELSNHSPNDDLDEEESARLGNDNTDLV